MLSRVLLFLVVLVFTPSLALGQETVIVPDAPPPADTSWPLLVTMGVFYVVTGAGLARKQFPQLVGWPTPMVLVPALSLGVGVYQVGYSDPTLLAKHAGLLYLTAYGGHEGGKRLLRWIFGLIAAVRAGTTIPPEPPLADVERPPSVPPAPKLPGALGTIGGFILVVVAYAVLTGCGGMTKAEIEKSLNATATYIEISKPCVVRMQDQAEADCAGDAACIARVQQTFEPAALGLEAFGTLWCFVSPKSEGCENG
jgi:hypothetical protein